MCKLLGLEVPKSFLHPERLAWPLRPGTAELPCAGALLAATGGVDSKGSGDPGASPKQFHAVQCAMQDGLCASKGPSQERYDLRDKMRLADFLIDADIRLVTPPGLSCLSALGVLQRVSFCF